MTEPLTPAGYEQTKEKLADLERRLAQIEKRTDLGPEHLASVRRSYRMMMREYLQEIKLYEAKQGKRARLREAEDRAEVLRHDGSRDATLRQGDYNGGGEVFMSIVKARFDGRVFVPEGPVDLPVGCELEITLPAARTEEPANRPLVGLADLLARFPENPQWPADGAAQHDHYLYGTPKKT